MTFVICFLFFLNQNRMPLPGLTSGNTTFGTTRICDAEAPEGKSVIASATVTWRLPTSKILEELTFFFGTG